MLSRWLLLVRACLHEGPIDYPDLLAIVLDAGEHSSMPNYTAQSLRSFRLHDMGYLESGGARLPLVTAPHWRAAVRCDAGLHKRLSDCTADSLLEALEAAAAAAAAAEQQQQQQPDQHHAPNLQ